MTARKMTVKGVEIPASVLDAVDAKLAECTILPFARASLSTVVSAALGRVNGADKWPAFWWGDGPECTAERIIQRHRKSGRIVQSKRGQWLWVAATSELSHGEAGDWKGRAYTMARHMIHEGIQLYAIRSTGGRTPIVKRADAIDYMRGHGWLTFTDADLDAATEGEDIRWA